MKRFSYFTEVFKASGVFGGKLDQEEFDQVLNDLGQDGWELVSVTAATQAQGTTGAFICVFKREIV